MHTVVCDKCGQECQVPFRPTAGKPVYCDACFRNKDDFEPRGRQPPSSGSSDMKEINKKLDKIISILEKFEVVDE
jgi:CxxC-x17-CxxC domain-containing protein